jgi:hypothetical protein
MMKFNPSAPQSARAVQAWQILVGMAKSRQTVTYKDLSWLMYGRRAQGVLSKILGHIAAFCKEAGVPLLVAIVVGANRGTPGSAIPVEPAKIDSEREKVYKYDWYDIFPPSEQDLESAWQRARKHRGKRLRHETRQPRD